MQDFLKGGVFKLDAGHDAVPALKKVAQWGDSYTFFFFLQKMLCKFSLYRVGVT